MPSLPRFYRPHHLWECILTCGTNSTWANELCRWLQSLCDALERAGRALTVHWAVNTKTLCCIFYLLFINCAFIHRFISINLWRDKNKPPTPHPKNVWQITFLVWTKYAWKIPHLVGLHIYISFYHMINVLYLSTAQRWTSVGHGGH